MSHTDVSWLKQLPTFPYLPQESPSIASALIKPFSLFSLFRSIPALPPTKLLDSLWALATPPSTHEDALSPSAVNKALLDVNAYISQIQLAANDARHRDAIDERISEIVQAYFATFYVASLASVSPIQPHTDALRKTAQDALRAIFILRDHLSPETHPAIYGSLDAQILAATFPPRSTHYYLTPLFSLPRRMVDQLSLATRVFTKLKAQHIDVPSEEDAMLVYQLLKTAAKEVEELGGIGVDGKLKKEKHEARRRALRVAIELDVWRAELAFAMTNANMAAVKARAGATQEAGIVADEEAGDVELGEVEEEGVQPNLDPEDDEISLPDAPLPKLELPPSQAESKIKWEDLTEDTLVMLLREARTLVEDGHGSVLSDHIERGDWLGHLPEEVPLPGTPEKRGTSLSAEADGDEEDEEFDELSESSDEESVAESHSCPLRSIFSLYDRFEEQRLAVWTSMPGSTNAHKGRRKEMEEYMRGRNGLAGDAGEELGLVLLIEYDRYGLSYDKLDKWLELASNRNAKKIKRRKAAALATRGRGGAKKAGGHRKTESIANLDIPAARTRGRSKTPGGMSAAGSSRGGTPKRGRKAKE